MSASSPLFATVLHADGRPFTMTRSFSLNLDPDELSTCVACGLCLSHCPTFRETGEEALSPRGRIAAMRVVSAGAAPADTQFEHFMETCVQCRACEPACPSGVPFGRLMEGTRDALASSGRGPSWFQRRALDTLPHRFVLLAGSSLIGIAQRVGLVPRRLVRIRVPIKRTRRVRSDGDDVWLFTGCVMDAWMRDVNVATAAVIRATGTTVAVPPAAANCCGALHVHAGLAKRSRQIARRVMATMPGDAPILVNSAGCGAALKDYGHLIGTDEARRFSARVLDVHEWLAPRVADLPTDRRKLGPVVVQDPCHLRHVQRCHLAVRTVLSAVADPVELDDDGLCCGAGGAYSVLQPELAGRLRERKWRAIERATARTGATIIASANPGCIMHLSDPDAQIVHPMQLVAASLRGDRD